MTAYTRCSLSAPTHHRQLPLGPTARLLATLVFILSISSCAAKLDHSDQLNSIESDKHLESTTLDKSQTRAAPSITPKPITANVSESARQVATDWKDTIDREFSVARELVEAELLVDLDEIRLQLVNDQPINKEVAIETQRLIKNQFGESHFSDRFLEQIMDPLAGTYAALYSSRLKSVMVSRSMLGRYASSVADNPTPGIQQAALLTLLIHELVHAADDLRYRIHDNRALNFRASFAQSATFEGHAQHVTRNICKKAGCSAGLQALDNFMFSTDRDNQQLTQPVEAVSRNVLEYSYVEGERFIKALSERSNADQLIDDLLSSPPLDPIQILAPDTYPDAARDTRNQRLIDASRHIDHKWTESPWIGVETSPLKGVDLRADPVRRQAAVDGFTLLIKAMISMQFYDQQMPGNLPVESTVMLAESNNTARLFANMLHSNTQHSGARISEELLNVGYDEPLSDTKMPVHIYRTAIDGYISFRTSIAVSGNHVVQVSGDLDNQDLLDDYAVRVLLKLQIAAN